MKGGAVFPVRLRYAKRGRIRFLGHRDLARAFERALRVEALPLAFSAGFTPHPRLSFGLALPTGYESDVEYLDVELTRPVELDLLPAALSEALPEGVDVTGVALLADRAPALQDAVTVVTWRVEVTRADGSQLGAGTLAATVGEVLGREELPTRRVRKGREIAVDLRPAIRSVDLRAEEDVCEMEMATQPRGARPGEVLAAAADALSVPGGLAEGHVRRTHQWIERNGARYEPLDVDTRPRVPEARAS